MPNKIAVNRLAHQNLQSILDDGCNGKLPDMSKEDWILLEHLVVKHGETSYNRGRNKGVLVRNTSVQVITAWKLN